MLLPFLFAVLLHELGHIVAILLLKGKLCGASFSPFGLTLRAKLPESLAAKTAIALSGPAVGIICYLLVRQAEDSLWLFGEISLFISIFNLLPALPLDGGKALLFCLSAILPEEIAYTLARSITLVFSLLLWTASGYLMLFCDFSPSLFFLSLWLLFSLLFPHRVKSA